MEISIVTIFIAGLLSFLSPCVLPLVPPYLTYLAGVSIEQLKQNKQNVRIRVLVNALCFVTGFSVIFIALGAGASAIGDLLRQYQNILAVVAGILIILMGAHFLGVLGWDALNREWRIRFDTTKKTELPKKTANPKKTTSLTASGLMGMAFAFGWTPCIGPVLGAILSVAGTKQTVAEGAGLLAIYSAGLAVPFLIAAAFTNPFLNLLNRVKAKVGIIQKITGALLVGTGILFLTGGIQDIAFFLLEMFPSLQKLG